VHVFRTLSESKLILRVLHVTSKSFGGSGKYLTVLGRGMRRHQREIELSLCYFRTGAAQDVEIEDAFDRRIVSLPVRPSIRNPLAICKNILEIVKVLNAGNYDIVHSHTSLGGFMGRVGARLAKRRPVVFHTLHAFGADEFTPQPQKAFFAVIERWLDRWTDAYIAPSQHMASYGARLGLISPSKVHVVPNSMPFPAAPDPAVESNSRRELRARLGIAEKSVVILYCGRLEYQKGVDILLKAARCLDPDLAWELVICGDGGLSRNLSGLAENLGIGSRVHWMGWQRDLSDFYASADIFAMASRWESFGLVFLEAMYHGLPIVASRIQAVPEVVTDGRVGLLSSAENPEDLARNLTSLISDERRRRELGEAGRSELKERFAFAHFVDRNLALYRQLLNKDAKRVIGRRDDV
jgi:glycosyltransferase involved in cell wall biosynthesis